MDARNASKLDIKMFSGYTTLSTIHGPEYYLNNQQEITPRTSIECMYSGCDYINFYSKNGLLDWNIYYNFPACDQFINDYMSYCHNISECVGSWSFHCDAGYGSFQPSQSLSCQQQCCDNATIESIEQQLNDEYIDECTSSASQLWQYIVGGIGGAVALLCLIGVCYVCKDWGLCKRKDPSIQRLIDESK